VGSYLQFGVRAIRLIFLLYNKRSARFRTCSRGSRVHLAILSTGGLGPVLTTLARRRRCRWNSTSVSIVACFTSVAAA
jgi:hypothetical protein